MATLHRLQTSSVAVVKECLHTVDEAMAEDVFACPFVLVSEFFARRDQVTFHLFVRLPHYAVSQARVCVCVCLSGYSHTTSAWGLKLL